MVMNKRRMTQTEMDFPWEEITEDHLGALKLKFSGTT